MTIATSEIRLLEEIHHGCISVVELVSPPLREYPLAGLVRRYEDGRKLVLFKRDGGQFGRLIYRMTDGENIGEVDLESAGVNLGPGQFVFDYRLNHFGFMKNTLNWVLNDKDLKGAGL